MAKMPMKKMPKGMPDKKMMVSEKERQKMMESGMKKTPMKKMGGKSKKGKK